MTISPLAGKPVDPSMLVNIPELITAYYVEKPDPSVPAERVAFGTSGHRGSAFKKGFNEDHILAISQAICLYRKIHHIDGPLFIGMDTHALSVPALATALEVLAANEITVLISDNNEYTPTPAISHAILTHNRGRNTHMADGIVITPSHNPPEDGGFKYNPPNGGPAGSDITAWIENKANELLTEGVQKIKRMSYAKALQAPTTHRHDYIRSYVNDLDQVIDMAAIRDAKISLGVDPLGGAGVNYWAAIVDRYGIDLTIVDSTVDPTFRFMTLDWDGRIRMDPSSIYTMQRLIGLKDRFHVAWGCDSDYDRHGIITRDGGLIPPNHYLAACISYLFKNRPLWPRSTAVGKTLVSSQMIDRVTADMGLALYEVPVGFKWFVDGLLNGTLGFGGEESAGASFLRMDGSAWSTDKDGIIACLLAAEMTARTGLDPAQHYQELTQRFGAPVYARIDAPATPTQKAALGKLDPSRIQMTELAGEKIEAVLTRAPGNDASIGGLKVVAANGWFAARPSGTEDIYKIYAESFEGEAHLQRIQAEAQEIVTRAVQGK